MSIESVRRRSNGVIDTDFYRAKAARERALMQAVVGRLGIETVRLAFTDAARLAATWSLPGTVPARVRRTSNMSRRSA